MVDGILMDAGSEDPMKQQAFQQPFVSGKHLFNEKALRCRGGSGFSSHLVNDVCGMFVPYCG
jgi:hypothetical protein